MKHPTIGNPHVKILFLAILGMIAFFFSWSLMFRTFSYNSNRGELIIASKAWSDFGAHIPLIRSFSYGPNLSRLLHAEPVESPLYPGEPIRYHYGFYGFAGFLERLGIRIDWALNIPSVIGFFALLVSMYGISRRWFSNTVVSLLSVIFFLFNGSLSFFRYFSLHPLSPSTITDILFNSKFTSFGPWDGGTITAFWTLNIYTNQRHLALSYALIIILISLFQSGHKNKWRSVLGGGLLGLLFFVNYAAAGIAILFLSWIWLIRRESRLPIIVCALVSVFPFLFLLQTANLHSGIVYDPGYLMKDPQTVMAFVRFWFDNLGFHSLFIPLGMLLSPKPVRKLLVPPLLALFILPNLFRFSPDMINNHKFFNFFLLIGGMFSALAIVKISERLTRIVPRGVGKIPMRILATVCSGVLVITLTLSGIIDIFPVFNDYTGGVPDIVQNPDARFILENTKSTDIVANSTWFYHPASLAGRAVYSGYTYFTWSYGYDDRKRESILVDLYRSTDRDSLCPLLKENHIAMVELNNEPEEYLKPNIEFWNNFIPQYKNNESHRTLYLSASLCETEQ